MQYLWRHAEAILADYRGTLPMQHVLKGYYRAHPEMGSRDRRLVNAVVYAWLRIHRFVTQSRDRRQELMAGLLLCAPQTPQLARLLPEAWLQASDPAAALEADGFRMEIRMPFDAALSPGLSSGEWTRSMLQQPDTFFRWLGGPLPAALDPHHPVAARLEYPLSGDGTKSGVSVAVPAMTPLDQLLPERAYVIQDRSSQRTGMLFQPSAGEHWWDCCSGAGGKSLLLTAIEPKVKLTVSDRRASILHNLSERFARHGYAKPERLELDLSDPAEAKEKLGGRLFDGIICDVPCSGSGTWARTPEQFCFFDPSVLTSYMELQRKIARNAALRLKPGGRMIYITCSVFAAENEENLSWLLSQDASLSLELQQLINGIGEKADCMFAAVLRKK